jgi:hypothetical protein
MGFVMPSGLHRTYGAHHLHFITCSWYRRLAGGTGGTIILILAIIFAPVGV